MIRSCYIHIPFCKSICSYCDFCKMLYNENLVDKYLDSLKKEIDINYKNDILDTIYIGGGTPSCLSFKLLSKLFNILKSLKTSDNVEYTIECNFDSIDIKKLKLFKKYGVNRISFGLESIDKNNLKILGRSEDKEKTISIIKLCRNLGFNNINIDLMYAINGEDISVLEKDLDFIISLNPEHISTYSLMIEKHTKLYLDKFNYISEDIDYFMYKKICNILKKNKYIHYEISNFSRDGYQSLHNLTYWKNFEYYGFGLGASSYIELMRKTNTRSISKYLNGEYYLNEEQLDFSDKVIYEVILGLRLLEGINVELFRKKIGKKIDDLFDIDSLIKDKLLVLDGNSLFINEDKLYVSNEILIKLIDSYKSY